LQNIKSFNGKKGIGRGISVLDLIREFESATGMKVAVAQGERRFGDVGTLICDSTRALRELDWVPKYDLPTMCKQDTRHLIVLVLQVVFCACDALTL
jgi:UDP-glucose 4-epimerase